MSMEIVLAMAEAYAANHTTEASDLLQAIAAETEAHHAQPHMLSGHVQGRFLSFISRLVQPSFVLEIGSFTGYSALCLAEGLVVGGQLHTIELKEADVSLCQHYFDRSPYGEKIILHQGNAKEIIPTLPHPWDIVFIDADKTGYIDYYEMVVPQLSSRGIIIADNVLFHGHVLNEPIQGKSAKAIAEFNNHVRKDPRVEQVMVTLRDGLLLIKKK